jgi:hypothetical protein
MFQVISHSLSRHFLINGKFTQGMILMTVAVRCGVTSSLKCHPNFVAVTDGIEEPRQKDSIGF